MPIKSNLFLLIRRLVLVAAVIFGSLSSVHAHGSDGSVVLEDQPSDIDGIIPQRHVRLDDSWRFNRFKALSWDSLRDGVLVSAAFMSAYYSPEHYVRLHFLLRDSALLGYAVRLIEPNLDRVRFLAVSRVSAAHPNLKKYLEQEGIVEGQLETLAEKDKRILIYDSGFFMSIGKKLMEPMNGKARSAVDFQLSQSTAPDVPSLYSLGFDRSSEREVPTYALIVKLAQAPKSTGRVFGYRQIDGRWMPIAYRSSDDNFQGNSGRNDRRSEGVSTTISKIGLQRQLEDLAHRYADVRFQEILRQVRKTVTEWNRIARDGTREQILAALKRFLAHHPQFGVNQAVMLVADWIDAYRVNPIERRNHFLITNQDVGIQKKFDRLDEIGDEFTIRTQMRDFSYIDCPDILDRKGL